MITSYMYDSSEYTHELIKCMLDKSKNKHSNECIGLGEKKTTAFFWGQNHSLQPPTRVRSTTEVYSLALIPDVGLALVERIFAMLVLVRHRFDNQKFAIVV